MNDRRVDGLVLATDEKGGIGKNGKLPWERISEDMKRFHNITSTMSDQDLKDGKKNVVIMGRKTFDSLDKCARPLKGRINVVVTSNSAEKIDNCQDGSCLQDIYFVSSYEEALTLSDQLRENNWASKVFGIGGSSCYDALLFHAKLVYITQVHGIYKCDTFFNLNFEFFEDVEEPRTILCANGIECTFRVLRMSLN